jgi:hypothetical protein
MLDYLDELHRYLNLNGLLVEPSAGDSTSDINAAIEEAGSSGLVTFMPGAIYNISDTINLTALQNIELRGNGGSGDTNLNTTFKWNGTNGGTVVLFDRTRDSYMHGFSIIPGTGTIGIGIRVDHASAPSGSTLAAHNIYERLSIGASTTAVQIGNSSTANNDLHSFRDVNITGSGTNGYLINHSQSKWIEITGGALVSRTNGIQTVAGSFRARGVNFSGNTNDIYLGSPTDTIVIDGCQSESSDRFLTDTGGDSNKWAVTISNCRLSPDSLHADGEYIQYQKGGPLTLIGNDLASGTYEASWLLRCSSGSGDGTPLICIGNTFPNGAPFVTGTRQVRISLGNTYIGSGSTQNNLMTEILVGPSTVSDVSLAQVIATASLPAAAAARNGTMLIEDAGAGDRNLIIYAGGQRFRIDGGAAF